MDQADGAIHQIITSAQFFNTTIPKQHNQYLHSYAQSFDVYASFALVRGTDNAPQLPNTLASLEASELSTVQPPAQAQAHNSIHSSNSSLLKLTTQVNESSAQLKVTPKSLT